MLSRILNKKYNYQAEVIDPRHYQVVGVQNRQCEYVSDMASYYDLVIGLHPDEAVREVVESAKVRPGAGGALLQLLGPHPQAGHQGDGGGHLQVAGGKRHPLRNRHLFL